MLLIVLPLFLIIDAIGKILAEEIVDEIGLKSDCGVFNILRFHMADNICYVCHTIDITLYWIDFFYLFDVFCKFKGNENSMSNQQ